MANEITESVALILNNVDLKLQFPMETKTITQSTALAYVDTIAVSSGAESDVPVGSVTTPGRVVLKNIDPTNFVKAGPKSGGSMIEAVRLKPGEHTAIRIAPSVTWRWIADTASCKVLIFMLND